MYRKRIRRRETRTVTWPVFYRNALLHTVFLTIFPIEIYCSIRQISSHNNQMGIYGIVIRLWRCCPNGPRPANKKKISQKYNNIIIVYTKITIWLPLFMPPVRAYRSDSYRPFQNLVPIIYRILSVNFKTTWICALGYECISIYNCQSHGESYRKILFKHEVNYYRTRLLIIVKL